MHRSGTTKFFQVEIVQENIFFNMINLSKERRPDSTMIHTIIVVASELSCH